MNMRSALLPGFISLFFLSGMLPVLAEQSQSFGEYTVHYNTINTSMLDPEVARGYGITRSKNRALLNVSVLKNVMGTSVHPVKAKVSATATNLSAQLRDIKIRELEDGGAIYYIGEFPISNEETLSFNIRVQPEGQGESQSISFQQQFFTD